MRYPASEKLEIIRLGARGSVKGLFISDTFFGP
jgi:hypothetical protein